MTLTRGEKNEDRYQRSQRTNKIFQQIFTKRYTSYYMVKYNYDESFIVIPNGHRGANIFSCHAHISLLVTSVSQPIRRVEKLLKNFPSKIQEKGKKEEKEQRRRNRKGERLRDGREG